MVYVNCSSHVKRAVPSAENMKNHKLYVTLFNIQKEAYRVRRQSLEGTCIHSIFTDTGESSRSLFFQRGSLIMMNKNLISSKIDIRPKAEVILYA